MDDVSCLIQSVPRASVACKNIHFSEYYPDNAGRAWLIGYDTQAVIFTLQSVSEEL
jgi:hypothetical protein